MFAIKSDKFEKKISPILGKVVSNTPIKRAIALLRQEGEINRLYVLSKASMTKPLKTSYLKMEDLDFMPNGIKWFGRNKLSHDLGI